jgi:hypothetical protein
MNQLIMPWNAQWEFYGLKIMNNTSGGMHNVSVMVYFRYFLSIYLRGFQKDYKFSVMITGPQPRFEQGITLNSS